MVTEAESDTPWRQRVRFAAAGALGAEALGAVVWAIDLVRTTLAHQAAEPGGAVLLAAILVGLAAVLVLLARGVLRRSGAVKVPVFLLQAVQALSVVEGVRVAPLLVGLQLLLSVVAGVGVLLPGVVRPRPFRPHDGTAG